MKQKIWTIIGAIGIFLIFAGGAALDSKSMALPVIMVAAGLVLSYLSSRVITVE